MKVLLAGATGAIGRPLLCALAASGHQVVAVIRNPANQQMVTDLGATAVVADVLNRDALLRAVDGIAADAVVHLARIFFTGAFRRPREVQWVTGALLMILATFEGYFGYSLPDDLLSGIGLRAALSSITLGLPVIGTWLHWALFGGDSRAARSDTNARKTVTGSRACTHCTF
jgi:NAD(P)-dependent dehydrogenase (short-subunit alcohol dehydrogenase family)